MKRCLIYIVIFVAVLAVPVERTDVGQLRPVQTVALYSTQEGYRIETDTEDVGVGSTVDAAFADLIETTPGVIYLDTADYLLVMQGAEDAAQQLRGYLKDHVRICAFVGVGELKTVSKYLSVRNDIPLIRQWDKGEKLPTLDCREERIKFL